MANAFTAAFDALTGPRFVGAGMADAAVFSRGGVETIMDVVMVDSTQAQFGNADSIVQDVVTSIRLFKRFGIPEPMHGDQITVGGTAYLVDAVTDQDESSYVVVVTG